jgi:hypothetical protein
MPKDPPLVMFVDFLEARPNKPKNKVKNNECELNKVYQD